MASKLSIFVGLLLAGAAICVGIMLTQPKAPSLLENYPPLYDGPEFALFDSAGELFEDSALDGKIWVADFFFTSCGGPCPRMTAAMAELAEAYKDAPDLRFVSYTVDPDTDTPERLAAYAERYGADTSRWHFLTGPNDEIQRIAVDGFKLGSIDNPVIHSERFALVDRSGQIRGYFTGTDAEELQELRGVLDAMLKG